MHDVGIHTYIHTCTEKNMCIFKLTASYSAIDTYRRVLSRYETAHVFKGARCIRFLEKCIEELLFLKRDLRGSQILKVNWSDTG